MSERPFIRYVVCAIVAAVLTALIVIASIVNAAPVLFAYTLVVFVLSLLLSTIVYRDVAYALFLVSFYVFLLGREVLFAFFGVDRYFLFDDAIEGHAYLSLALSLSGTLVAYVAAKEFVVPGKNAKKEKCRNSQEAERNASIAVASKSVMLACVIPLVISLGMRIYDTLTIGYVESYVAGAVSKSSLGEVLRVLGETCVFATFVYLSTFPRKRNTIKCVLFLLAYSLLTLLTGGRSMFIGLLFILVIYLDQRSLVERKKHWLSARKVAIALVLVPVLVAGMTVLDAVRVNKRSGGNGVVQTFAKFFDQQGGSINIIKREMLFKDRLPKGVTYSISGTQNAVTGNVIVRTLTGSKMVEGNSTEHALKGNSLAHTLSYYTDRDYYLQGHGWGSCYVAENYHDWGYAGVILGGIAYGVLISLYGRAQWAGALGAGLLMRSMEAFFLTPRDSFDAPLSCLLSLGVLVGVAAIAIIAGIRGMTRRSVRKRAKRFRTNAA